MELNDSGSAEAGPFSFCVLTAFLSFIMDEAMIIVFFHFISLQDMALVRFSKHHQQDIRPGSKSNGDTMSKKSNNEIRAAGKYTTSISGEGFMSYELRIAAKLLAEGLDREAAVKRIVSENLFQYPTEKSLQKKANAAMRLLAALPDESLILAIAEEPSETSKQICLYAMMRHYRLVRDFMVSVIGEKYRLKETFFSRADVNIFFMRLQEQNDAAARWSDSTVEKMEQVLMKTLAETGYVDKIESKRLNSVLISPILEKAIRADGDVAVLPAFDCFSQCSE